MFTFVVMHVGYQSTSTSTHN